MHDDEQHGARALVREDLHEADRLPGAPGRLPVRAAGQPAPGLFPVGRPGRQVVLQPAFPFAAPPPVAEPEVPVDGVPGLLEPAAHEGQIDYPGPGWQEPAGSGGRGLQWCFTLNNYTHQEEAALEALVESGALTYLVYGREVAPSTGTPHLQGYCRLSGGEGQRKRRNQVRRLLGGRVYLALLKGTPQQAAAYCKKGSQTKASWKLDGVNGPTYGLDADVVEFGVLDPLQRPGRRCDLDEVRMMIRAGTTRLDIADAHFAKWCFHDKAFEKYRKLIYVAESRIQLRVILLWGAPGSGKSYYAHAAHPGRWYDSPSPKAEWFDGYDVLVHDAVLFDDIGDDIPLNTFKKLLDIYPMQVPTKGDFVPYGPSFVYVTTNAVPSSLYSKANDADRAAWKRRFHAVLKFDIDIGPDGKQVVQPPEVTHAKVLLNPMDWE